MIRQSDSRRSGALTGITSAALGLAGGEIVAAVTWPHAAPLTAVGDASIALAPEALVRWTIDLFGTADKLVLTVGILAVLAAASIAIGRMYRRRRGLGIAGVAVFAALGVVAALTRPPAVAGWALPSVAAGLVSMTGLWLLTRWSVRLETDESRPGRRGFLVSSAGLLFGAAVGGYAARVWGGVAAAEAARDDIVLPAPSDPAPSLPSDVSLRVSGLAPWRTSNDDFYRIDTALSVPRLDPKDYRLRIFGQVAREIEFGYADLLSRRLIERDLTLSCVSNEVGGYLVGNARWLGVPLAELLEEAGPSAGADQLVARSSDGFTAGAPTRLCRDGRDAMLAVGMNGAPLPVEHGFPVRMIVPGLYGYVSATKWLVELELTSFEAFDAYWIRRGWSRPSRLKTASRIDTPRETARAGTVAVAGVAWAQHRGISGVEVRVDDGDWHEARLSGEVSDDVWRQWVWEWDAEPGEHTLTVRAIDGSGRLQTSQVAPVTPDGASGWHSVDVTVE